MIAARVGAVFGKTEKFFCFSEKAWSALLLMGFLILKDGILRFFRKSLNYFLRKRRSITKKAVAHFIAPPHIYLKSLKISFRAESTAALTLAFIISYKIFSKTDVFFFFFLLLLFIAHTPTKSKILNLIYRFVFSYKQYNSPMLIYHLVDCNICQGFALFGVNIPKVVYPYQFSFFNISSRLIVAAV